MRSTWNALAVALLVLAALGLALMGLHYQRGRESQREVALAVETTASSPSPPPPEAPTPEPAYPGPDAPPSPTAMPEDATPYPEPPQPTSTDTPWPTDTLSPDDLTIVAELTESASYTREPTPTPPPPTPTATPLPPLDPGLETMIYAVQREVGPELMRLQVDAEGRPVGPPQAFTPPGYRQPRASVLALYPSPAGRYVAVLHGYAESVDTALVDTQDWSVGPLMPDPLDHGLWATPRFLDWSPDGRFVLLRGAINYLPEMENLWLLNLEDHEYRVLPALEGSAPYSEGRTAFAADGTSVAVAIDRDFGERVIGEAWVIPLEGGESYRIADGLEEHGRVQWVEWSPHGDALALAIQRDTAVISADIVRCELWLVPLDGDQPRRLDDASIDPPRARYVKPLWEPRGTGIIFVRSETGQDTELWGEFTSNLYRVDVATGETTALTAFEGTTVLAPHWAPGDVLTFATGQADAEPLPVWRLPLGADGRPAGEASRIDDAVVTGGSLWTAPGIVWLPREATDVEDR